MRSIKKRILIADEDGLTLRQISDYLNHQGFDTRTTSLTREARELIEFWKPDAVIADLSISLSLFRFLGSSQRVQRPAILVMSSGSTPQVIEQLCRAGASDVWEKPFLISEMITRLEDLLEPTERTVDLFGSMNAKIQELHLLSIFLKQATSSAGDSNCLHNLMRMVSLRTGALRTSLVRVASSKKGVVLASNDDAFVRGYAIDLEKYPEILAVMKDQKSHYIHDWQERVDFQAMATYLQKTPYESLAVFPLFIDQQFFGVMSLRLKRQPPQEAQYVQKLGELCSKILSLTLRDTAEARAA